MRPVLNFAFCVNDGYARYIGVTIQSILANHKNDNVKIYVLTDYISAKNKEWLTGIMKQNTKASIFFVEVDDAKLRGLKDTWSIYTWYRVLLPEVLPEDVERILYLDADTIVAGNLKELFDIDMTNSAIAGTLDYETLNVETFSRCGYEQSKGYVCAGVLLMNLQYWRQHNLSEKVIRWGYDNNDRIKFPDQDTINYLCRDSKILLPLRYDIVDGFFGNEAFYAPIYKEQLRDCIERPAIIHYAGQRPWIIEQGKHIMQHYWVQYNNSLSNPVKRRYESKGLLKIKVMLWHLFHPHCFDSLLSKEYVLKKLAE